MVCTNSFGAGPPSTITVTGIVPTVAITAPVNGSNTTNATTNVAYTVNGAASIPAGTTCTVNGASSTSTSTNSVSLALGANTIPVVCTNVFGASTTQTVTVNRGNPPVVTITSPANNSNSTVSPVQVQFQVGGVGTIPAGTTCTINGASTTTPGATNRADRGRPEHHHGVLHQRVRHWLGEHHRQRRRPDRRDHRAGQWLEHDVRNYERRVHGQRSGFDPGRHHLHGQWSQQHERNDQLGRALARRQHDQRDLHQRVRCFDHGDRHGQPRQPAGLGDHRAGQRLDQHGLADQRGLHG